MGKPPQSERKDGRSLQQKSLRLEQDKRQEDRRIVRGMQQKLVKREK